MSDRSVDDAVRRWTDADADAAVGPRERRCHRCAARLPHAARRGDRRCRPRHQHGSWVLGGGHRPRCASDGSAPGELLTRVGATLIYRVGGAAGPLFGTVLPPSWGVRSATAETFDAEDLLTALRAGLDGDPRPGRRGRGRQDDRRCVRAGRSQAFERDLRAGRRRRAGGRTRRGRGREGRVRATRADAGAEGPGLLPGASERRDIRIQARPRRRCSSPRSAQGRSRRAGRDAPPPRERRGTIQSVDRAARILKALGSGILAARRHRDRRSARPREGHRLRPPSNPRSPGAGGAGPRDGQVPARAGDAPAGQRLPGQPRAPRPVAAVGRLARLARGRGRARGCAARAERADRPSRVPAGQLRADPRGGRVDPVARVRARQGDRRLPRPRTRGRALVRHDLAPLTGRTVDRSRAAACWRSTTVVARRSGRSRTRRPSWGRRRSPPPVFDHRGYPAGAIGVVGPVERLVPEGKAVGRRLSAAVRETARGLSRDMGAGRVGRARLSRRARPSSASAPHRLALHDRAVAVRHRRRLRAGRPRRASSRRVGLLRGRRRRRVDPGGEPPGVRPLDAAAAVPPRGG